MRREVSDLTPAGYALLAAVAVLLGIGLATIYVTDTHYVSGHDGPRNAARQAVFILVGAFAGILVLRVGYQTIARHAYIIFIAGVLLLLPLFFAKVLHTTFGGLTAPRNGAYRWIHLPGYQLQPSEFIKVAYLVALAWYLRYRKNYLRFTGLLIPFAISFIPLTLILLEPDLGTVLMLLPVLFAMLFAAGARLLHLGIIVLLGAAAVPLLWQKLEPYQRLRVTALLLQSDVLRQAVIDEPERFSHLATRRQAVEWSAGSGYQLVQSKNAIGSGGILGHGWGEGIYASTSLLPDRHNDFVFSVVAHQWGFVGAMVVLGCFTVIVLVGLRIASATTEPFARLLAVGVVTLFATQFVINAGMAGGLMPVTGMTLPFVSYGGSSLLTNFVAIALLISVAQHRPFLLSVRPMEFGFKQTQHLPTRSVAGSKSAARPATDGA